MAIKNRLNKIQGIPGYNFWIFLVSSKGRGAEKGIVSTIQRVRVKGHFMYHFVASGLQFMIKVSSHRLDKITPEPIVFGEENIIKTLDILEAPSLREIFTK